MEVVKLYQMAISILLKDSLGQRVYEGYEVKQMIPEISPAKVELGTVAFYKSGFTVYLEKEE